MSKKAYEDIVLAAAEDLINSRNAMEKIEKKYNLMKQSAPSVVESMDAAFANLYPGAGGYKKFVEHHQTDLLSTPEYKKAASMFKKERDAYEKWWTSDKERQELRAKHLKAGDDEHAAAKVFSQTLKKMKDGAKDGV